MAGSLHLCFSRSFTPPDHVAFRCWGLQVSSSELRELEVPGSAWLGVAHTSLTEVEPQVSPLSSVICWILLSGVTHSQAGPPGLGGLGRWHRGQLHTGEPAPGRQG